MLIRVRTSVVTPKLASFRTFLPFSLSLSICVPLSNVSASFANYLVRLIADWQSLLPHLIPLPMSNDTLVGSGVIWLDRPGGRQKEEKSETKDVCCTWFARDRRPFLDITDYLFSILTSVRAQRTITIIKLLKYDDKNTLRKKKNF